MKQGWAIKQLGDVCSVQLGKTPHRKTPRFWDKNKETNNVWLSISDLTHGADIFDSKEYVSDLGAENINVTPKGTIMLSFKLTLGRVSFAGKDLLTNEAIASLIDLGAEISKKFIFYYFSYFDWDKASRGDVKVKGRTLNKAKLKILEIPIPPLDEQKHIVAKLDECFEAIDKARTNVEKNLNNAKELFQSQLNQIFSQKGDDWVEKKLGDITTILGDGLHGTPKYTIDGEYYFINGNNLDNGKIIYKNRTKRASFEEYEKYKKNLNDRTVFVSINGTLGNVAFYNNEKVILGKSACYFNLTEQADKNFIKYVILSPYFIDYAHKVATGVTIKNVSLKSMRELKINLPKIEEQKEIVILLDTLQSQTQTLESNYQQELDALDELKKSILQKAFNGEL